MQPIETLPPEAASVPTGDGARSAEDEAREFLASTVLFKGPDLEIMRDHKIAPRSADEEEAIAQDTDPLTRMLVRNRLQTAANESTELLSHIASAPAAKWGDLITGLFTASGDLAMASSAGLTVFSLVAPHPIKYVNKYWGPSASVGIRDGDVFTHNDARYGNVHQPDQSILLPIFVDGQLVAWAGAIIHEGENGAREPGGMPVSSESPYDEGLKMSPIKVGEGFRLRDDLVTYMQNSVRDPKLQLEDMRARLAACLRLRQRVLEVAKRYGHQIVVAGLRQTLEYTAEEARRRIAALPDGEFETLRITDSTLREPAALKCRMKLIKQGDTITIDLRGSSPEFMNRPLNTVLATTKSMCAAVFYAFVWPDLPRNQGVLDSIEFVHDEGSIFAATDEVPNACSVSILFQVESAVQYCLQKLLFNNMHSGNPAQATEVCADWWNEVNAFIFGGYTQYGGFTGNILTDVNGAAGGARSNRDGEHAMAPMFASMADCGEVEQVEDELPVIELSFRRLLRDNQGFGQYRGGNSYGQVITYRNSMLWGFGLMVTGTIFPHTQGLFGGYAAPVYPLMKVSGVDALALMSGDPTLEAYDPIAVMNEEPFAGATYSTHLGGHSFVPTGPGELWMHCQGAGAGYGDVLDRDPDAVVRDLADARISDWTAEHVYRVVWNRRTGIVDRAATEALRDEVRRERIAESVPFDEFEQTWVSDAPPEHLPFYGCWGDPDTIFVGGPATALPADQLVPTMVLPTAP